jgi:glycosyltransferase 2 family protein
VPATPGGIGTEQALLVYAFRDVGVARSTLLAFSVGMKLTITVINVVVGFLALFLTLGTVRYRSVVSATKPPPESADEPG